MCCSTFFFESPLPRSNPPQIRVYIPPHSSYARRFGMARWFVSPWALLVWFTTIPSNSPRIDYGIPRWRSEFPCGFYRSQTGEAMTSYFWTLIFEDRHSFVDGPDGDVDLVFACWRNIGKYLDRSFFREHVTLTAVGMEFELMAQFNLYSFSDPKVCKMNL